MWKEQDLCLRFKNKLDYLTQCIIPTSNPVYLAGCDLLSPVIPVDAKPRARFG